MPRFDDGAIDMQELLRRLAEQVVNAVMDAEADQLCGGGANRTDATATGSTPTLRILRLRAGTSTRKVQRVAEKMVSRLVARLPADDSLARRGGRGARRLGRPPGARPCARRGLPGRRVAALRGPPHARLHARGRLLAAQAPRGQERVAGVPRARRRHRDGHVPRGVRHAGGVLPEGGGGAGGGRARRAGLPRLSADPLKAPAHQQRPGENEPRDKAQVARRSGVPLHGLAGAVMCEQDEIWQKSRYFSEVRMNELYDDGRTLGIYGHVDWARLEAEARKMLESGLELADRVETA